MTIDSQILERMLHTARLATIGDMAAGIAHELNQPLTAIMSYAQAGHWQLDAQPPNLAELRDSLREIIAQAQRASGIVQRLQSLVKRGDSKQEILALDTLVDEIKSIILTNARLHSVRFSLALLPDLPPVCVDRIQLHQVILNLVRNAITALDELPPQERTLIIQSAVGEPGYVELCVCDGGPGVPLELRDRLFQPYVTTRPSGAGLGLTLSRMIVEAHNGALGYRPNEPRGACFFLHLPVAQGG